MIGGLAVLLVCQLAGEAAARLLGLPVPGPVLGMALLFAALLARGGEVPKGLADTADALLRVLGLLFVPAGVGVVLHLPEIARDWAPIALAILAGTLLTVGLTGLLAARLLRGRG
jgi:holin-like protein